MLTAFKHTNCETRPTIFYIISRPRVLVTAWRAFSWESAERCCRSASMNHSFFSFTRLIGDTGGRNTVFARRFKDFRFCVGRQVCTPRRLQKRSALDLLAHLQFLNFPRMRRHCIPRGNMRTSVQLLRVVINEPRG